MGRFKHSKLYVECDGEITKAGMVSQFNESVSRIALGNYIRSNSHQGKHKVSPQARLGL